MPVHDWTRVGDGVFHDFHISWVLEIKRALQRGILPPGYYVMAEHRAGDMGGPDVLTLQATGEAGPAGMTALVDSPPVVELRARIPAESYATRQRSLVVHHASDDRIVAIIEIVSRGNKSSRYALQSLIERAITALRAGLHLLLIDVHPPGPRDPDGLHGVLMAELSAQPYHLPAERQLSAASYAAGDGVEAFVQTFAVGSLLPTMPLFLAADFYVSLPLEPCYQAAFEDVPPRYREELGTP